MNGIIFAYNYIQDTRTNIRLYLLFIAQFVEPISLTAAVQTKIKILKENMNKHKTYKEC